MPRWRWCSKREGRGRPCSYLYISYLPKFKEFIPKPILNKEYVEVTYPEYEVLILSDLEKLTQEEIAERMKVSRGTIWRLLESAREKIALAIRECRPIIISSKGEVEKVFR